MLIMQSEQLYPSYAGLSRRTSGSKQLRGVYTRANSFASGIKTSIIYFIAGIFLGLIMLPFIFKTDNAYYSQSKVILEITVIPSPTPTPTPTVAMPQRLIIDKLAIDSSIEYVGLDGKGAMGTPQNFDNVAWYQDGPKPAEPGNAVIAGHFDKVTGAPAVFYNLTSLQVGDLISTIAEDGKVYTFAVTNKKIYPYNQVPLYDLFGEYKSKRLNLITCEGIFNRKTQNYSNRTVIYSDLIER